MKGEQDVNRVVEQYSDMIRRLCMIHLKNYADTEDIFQTVFLKYVLSSVSFENEEHEKAWFIRVTINLSKNKVHSFWHRNIDLSEDGIFPFHATRPESELLEAIRNLPKKYRAVIYLHYFEGYSLSEIAGLLNRNPNTVQTWHKQAKIILRKKIGAYYNERFIEPDGYVSKDT